MIDNKRFVAAAITGIMALGMTAASAHLQAADEDTEKCAGIVKTGMNDCGANGHGCAGQAKEDNDPNEWITLPKGTCEKIAGGTVVADDGHSM
ncbi:MAG: DUF2282 domain-containing protein [Thiolinea sp.]